MERKLAAFMHVIWTDGTFYGGDPAASQTDAAQRTPGKAASFWARIDEQCDDSSNAWRPHADGRQL